MARPRGRNGGRGSGRGGFSDRNRGGGSSRGASRGSARGSSRGSYSSGRGRGNGGNPQIALVAAIAGGAVVVVILLVVLFSRGGGGPDFENQKAATPETHQTVTDPDVKKIPQPPLTDAERKRIHDLIVKLAAREGEVIELKNAGFKAKDEERHQDAQQNWREAYDILTEMIDESNRLFTEIGEERVDYYAHSDYEATGTWGFLKSEIFKNLK